MIIRALHLVATVVLAAAAAGPAMAQPTPGVTAKGIPTGFGQPRQAFDAFQGQLGVKFTF